MQLNSYIFILAYLPIFILGYFGFNRISLVAGKLFLIVGSAIFYIYGGWNFAIILALSIVVNYLSAVIIKRFERFLFWGIFFNVILLIYFKFSNFFISNINNVFPEEFTAKEIIFPLGISFFTFQQIMYLINVSIKYLTNGKGK